MDLSLPSTGPSLGLLPDARRLSYTLLCAPRPAEQSREPSHHSVRASFLTQKNGALRHFLIYFLYSMGDTANKNEALRNTTPQESSFGVEHPPTQAPERQIPNQEQRELPAQHEIQKETQDGFLDESIDSLRKKLRRPKKQKPTQIPQVRDELTVKVEKIMEEGLVDAFKELSPVEKQEFKMKGEETALQIRELLKSTHIKIKKIFKLLFAWLKLLPGVNRFYLEQEAKIKADRIISMKDQYRN